MEIPDSISARLYAFSDSDQKSKAAIALGWLLFGVGLLIAATVFDFLRGRAPTATGFLGFLLVGLPLWLFLTVLWASFYWKQIPMRYFLVDIRSIESLIQARPFILVLWSIRDYVNETQDERIEWNKDVGRDIYRNERNWDTEVAKAARKSGLRAFRIVLPKNLWQGLNTNPRVAQLICGSACDWRDVICAAIPKAVAIVVHTGRGRGLAWELTTIDRLDHTSKVIEYTFGMKYSALSTRLMNWSTRKGQVENLVE